MDNDNQLNGDINQFVPKPNNNNNQFNLQLHKEGSKNWYKHLQNFSLRDKKRNKI